MKPQNYSILYIGLLLLLLLLHLIVTSGGTLQGVHASQRTTTSSATFFKQVTTTEEYYANETLEVSTTSSSSALVVVSEINNNNHRQIGIPPWFDGISLFDAIAMGNLEAVKYRVAVAGDNATGPIHVFLSIEPIHFAAHNGQLAITKYLVEEAGAQIDSRNPEGGETPLHLGAEGCSLDVIEYLVEKGANLSALDEQARSPIFLAALSNCVKGVGYLLEKGATKPIPHPDELLYLATRAANRIQLLSVLLDNGVPLEAKLEAGATPLQDAVWHRQDAVAKYLIARGANVNTIDANGDSPLHTAVRREAGLPLVEYLVESGANTNLRNGDNLTALEMSQAGSPLHQYLLEVGEDPSDFTTTTEVVPPPDSSARVPLEYKYLSLREAITSGDVDAVRFRISAGDQFPSSGNGVGPKLHFACEHGNPAIVKYLVEETVVDVNALDDRHHAPLQICVGLRSPELLRYLVARGANLSAADWDGHTALYEAVHGIDLESVQTLVELGADVNTKDKLGRTTLHLVTRRCYLHIVYFLVEHGADLNATDQYGDTSLANVVRGSSECDSPEHMIKYLVRSGSAVNSRNNEGKTALHHAAREMSPTVFRLLVESGADVNAKDEDGNSPLHDVAGWEGYAEERHLQVVKILVDGGAELNATNGEGQTPLDIFIQQGGSSEEIKRLLTPEK